jgi:hypothetical protein
MVVVSGDTPEDVLLGVDVWVVDHMSADVKRHLDTAQEGSDSL